METIPSIPELNQFFNAVAKDKRITMPQLCVYIALFLCWNKNGFNNPVIIRRSEIMQLAKISAKTTYHKCIKDLEKGGYIHYSPSFSPKGESEVIINLPKIMHFVNMYV